MASMIRISASTLLPSSRFPFSASFFRRPLFLLFSISIPKALRDPRLSRGFSIQQNPRRIKSGGVFHHRLFAGIGHQRDVARTA